MRRSCQEPTFWDQSGKLCVQVLWRCSLGCSTDLRSRGVSFGTSFATLGAPAQSLVSRREFQIQGPLAIR